MVWTTSFIELVACSGDVERPDARPTVADTAHTGVTDSATGDTGDTGLVVDTGPFPESGCTGLPSTGCVHLVPDELGDYAGRWIDVADMDGDGLADALVPEPAPLNPYATGSAVYLVTGHPESGPLAATAAMIVAGPFPDPNGWGDPSALVVGAAQVAVAHHGSADLKVKLFDIEEGTVDSARFAASIEVPSPYDNFFVPAHLAGCPFGGTPSLCVTTTNTTTVIPGDLAGQLLVYDAPLVGQTHILDARRRYLADPGDGAWFVDGETDLDSDGQADLVMGALYTGGTGRVAVLLDPPDGEHRLWDVAQATVSGVVTGGELGLAVAGGDLDDDGYGDVLTGAPIDLPAESYVLGGPHAGDRLASTAEWIVTAADGRWLGYDQAVGDFDGDGAPDLAVGAPWSIYDDDADPGNVFVFLAPSPGTYTPAQASITLASGVGVADAFGMSFDVGDLDGDGRDDLVVGAPRDPTAGLLAGSATILYAAGLE